MWGISWRCAYRERTHELFGTPLDLTDIQGFIAFQSWLDDDHEKTYLEAIDAGKITPLSGDLESLEKIAELDRDDIEGWLIVPSMTRNAFRAYEVTAEETQ
jgi:hypothetical protein